jgi:hypothetical protein
MRRIWLAVGLGLILFALGAAAFQWTNDKKDKPRDRSHRDVAGMVMRQDDTPVSGAVVKLKNLRNLQIRSFITQADGKYTFQNLSSSVDFELKAEYKDMASPTRGLTIYDTRLDPVINLKLEPAKK